LRKIGNTPLVSTQSMQNVMYSMAAQNMVVSSDPRVAWAALYQRGIIETRSQPISVVAPAGVLSYSYASYAQVIVIAAQARNTDAFSSADVNTTTTAGPSLHPTLYTSAVT